MKIKSTVREITWLPTTSHGWGNGYVLIPLGHPLHGIGYEELDNLGISVHGGVTYLDVLTHKRRSEMFPNFSLEDVGGWIIGFDTTHYGDTIENWPKKRVMLETQKLKRQIQKIAL